MVRSSRVARQHQSAVSHSIGAQRTARSTGIAKVTAALPLRANAGTQNVSIVDMNMELNNSILFRVSRFFSDRYAYRAQPDHLPDLFAFATIVLIAVWPVILVANALAVAPK